MGYIIALILLLIIVPLLFVTLGRRSSGAGTLDGSPKSGGFTPTRPSADVPTPRANSVNQPTPEGERHLPPG